MKPRSILLALCVLAAAAFSGQAFAQTGSATMIGQYGDWGVYVSPGSSRVCFALSQPRDRQPSGLKRDPAYIFLSTRPGDNIRNEFSVIAGFPLKEDSEPSAQIGNDSYTLYARKDGAVWIRNVAEEQRLIESLRRGRELVIKTTSIRGNETIDRYSLTGLTQALDRVAQECK
jgi:invasion protein IalB